MNYELEILNLKKRIEELENIVFKREHAPEQQNRDKTKYMFEGKVYPKNRLVLAIIKKYVENNACTYEQLSETFDKSLQGSLKVVELFDTATKISDASKRYFMKEEDVLNLQGERVWQTQYIKKSEKSMI